VLSGGLAGVWSCTTPVPCTLSFVQLLQLPCQFILLTVLLNVDRLFKIKHQGPSGASSLGQL